MILSLAFAERVHLGLDPSITTYFLENRIIYRFNINGGIYKTSTSNLISDIKADGVYNTGTRIYKAFSDEDMDGENPRKFIIKDYWLVDNQNPEDVIRQLILDDIKDTTERTKFKNHTLTPFASERVKINGCDEHTRNTLLRGQAPSDIETLELSKEDFANKGGTPNRGTTSYKDASGSTRESTARMKANRSREYVDRYHYRIVYEEDAIPFYKLDKINDMILVLEHSVEGKPITLLK